jgi:nickel/cobalt transporter (NicO) family protein
MTARGTLLVALVLGLPAAAGAHPLGNFTTNRWAALRLAPQRLAVRYVVDLAELPTFRALAELDADGDGVPSAAERAAWADRLAARVGAGLAVAVDGTRVALAPGARSADVLPGAAGLPTLRAELTFSAPLVRWRGVVTLADDTFAGLPGWQEVIAVAEPGVALAASSVPATDRSNALRAYPADLLAAPLAVHAARVEFGPGAAARPAPRVAGAVRAGAARFGDRLTALVSDRTPLTAGVLASALALALVLGAFHALTPGHGKTIVGAYLVGTRGTWRHAVLLGLVVTATHTGGVYALGAATLVASAWVLPERLLPWLGAVAGLLVVGVGARMVRERLQAAIHGHAHGPGHHHHHHDGGHAHLPAAAVSVRSLVALGVSGGLVPCPSALVVLLGAIALGRTGFGLGLVAAFSVGLAAVLTGIGLVLVHARTLFERLPLDGRVARAVPVASALLVSLVGLGLVVEAVARLAT